MMCTTMGKVLGILCLLILLAGALFSGWWFYNRYVNDGRHIERMQSALAARERFSMTGSVRFTDAVMAEAAQLVDLRLEGNVDVSNGAPTFSGSVAPEALFVGWKAALTERFRDGAFLARLRQFVGETPLFTDPQGGLVEILHGRAARLYTARLNPAAVVAFEELWGNEDAASRTPLWEAARVFLWIDQANNSLHRVVVQFADVAVLDVELEEWDGKPAELPIQLPNGEQRTTPVPASGRETLGGEGDATDAFPGGKDADGDGLSDEQEAFYRSDPYNPDTDGDGYSDAEEIQNGYNPNGGGALFNFGLPTL
ncbi:hypothetical protein HYW18_03500 [Candidatus Uhrbacteria bacterium]|nr:hypothetical protein [Candidatus Uhrbacteria bacterium]